MVVSAFSKWVTKYLPGVTLRIVKKLNDSTNELPYLFKSLLNLQYSVDGKWETIAQENALVSADFVSMDSSAPLKMRDSISKASGKIPKMAMELWLNETQLTALDALIAQGGTDAQIVAELFKDTKKTLGGSYELTESTFLEAFSTGQVLVTDDEIVGTGIRLDYGYFTANKFGLTALLSNPASKIWDDFTRINAKAKLDGVVIKNVYTDSATIDAIAALTQSKELYAFKQGFVGTAIPTPDVSQLNALASSRLGWTFIPVDRSIRREKNAIRTTYKPWKAGSMIFTTGGPVGSLVYAKLAEQNHPVAGVIYELVDGYILISKYRKNEPAVSEFTKMQARAVPVIANVDEIYLLDTTTVQA